MFDDKKVKELILAALVSDAYSLGLHWIYDEQELKNLAIDYNELNDAKALWHKEKYAGDFTHYGDHTLWLYEYVKDKKSFDPQEYLAFWAKKMTTYNGYIDGSSRETVEILQNNNSASTGSASSDLSIVGRVAPLLLISNSQEEFLQNVEKFVRSTHNSDKAVEASKFFALVLLEVLDQKGIKETLISLKEKFTPQLQAYVENGIASQEEESFQAIRAFGPACDIDGGFEGVVHLLCKYDNLKDMLVANAKAGGDTSARAMIAATIFMAQQDQSVDAIPNAWLKIKAKIA